MKNMRLLFMICISSMILFSCGKKTTPSSGSSTSVVKKPVAAKAKIPVPKVIVVNDNAAQKTVDGRFYYDLNGKRYWRNNRDGKYYLFNKSMYNSDDFKPVKTN